MKNSLFRYLVLASIFVSTISYAGQPLWTITPLTQTTVSVPINESTTILYSVTNQSTRSHTLVMTPITGITQDTDTTDGNCPHPFTLGYHQSCTLALEVDGSMIPASIDGGPKVCHEGEAFQCYQPTAASRLHITRTPAVAVITAGSPLTLTAEGSAGTLTITNTSSSLTATNISADLRGTALESNVTQDASDCISVAPNTTCELSFTPAITTVTATSFPIQGDNTTEVSGEIAVVSPTSATISVSGSPLALQGTTGTPVTGILTITNQSHLLTATNISANITGALATGGVTENSSACASLAPQASCNLVFTPSSHAVSDTEVDIEGDNTSLTTATIGVNAPPQASISITAGSPLRLVPTGSAGTLTITNNSTTENALSITSNFTSTALNGLVSQTGSTCSNVAPGATCTLSFTAGSTTASQTSFPIQGTNTTSVNGAISISLALGDSYQGGKVACLNGGLNNLVAANSDNSGGVFWGYNQLVGATDNDNGASNTALAVAAYSAADPPLAPNEYAAGICSSYEIDSAGNSPCLVGTCYSDWFLPARSQLSCLGTNRNIIGGFSTTLYWTSREGSSNIVYSRNFTNNTESNQTKNVGNRVRCVRAIT